MVFVKVRETYDLHTVKNKMTVIGIHTPKSDIIKRSYPGLLMQCRAYRPVSADVRLACASVLPLDPQGVGLAEGDVAPEDVFNPILYGAISNKGMSMLEARINAIKGAAATPQIDVDGDTAYVDVDSVTPENDEFPVYYGLLSNTNQWKHANPQSGLEMTDLRPLVYEVLYDIGDVTSNVTPAWSSPGSDGYAQTANHVPVVGNAREFPFLNCTAYTYASGGTGNQYSGFAPSSPVGNAEQSVPWINVICGAIIIPPSRLHEMFYRLVVEWTLEFSSIRPLQDIANWTGIASVGNTTHYQNYSYEATKKAISGDPDTILENDSCMVDSNVEINKVM